MATRSTTSLLSPLLLLLAGSVLSASAQLPSLSSIPGGQTASGVLASSADGLSRYLAPDGPIQPAATAIGGLPMRGVEMANKGLSRISSSLDSSAKSLSRGAGNDENGEIRMPGMQALESNVPMSIASMGEMMHGAIQQKNSFIRGQAEKGVAAGERLRSMMQNGLGGLRARSSGHMVGATNLIGGAQDALMRGASQIQNQIKQTLGGHMDRMQGVQGIGENFRNQAQGLSQTLSNGLSGTVEHLQRTGEQLHGQIEGGLKQNSQAMSGIINSMQGSMANRGQNMQKNLQGVIQQAQGAAQQVSSQIQEAVKGPLNMIQNLGSGLGSMMQGGGQSAGGRY